MAKRNNNFIKTAKKSLTFVLVISMLMSLLSSFTYAAPGDSFYHYNCETCDGTGNSHKFCDNCDVNYCNICGGDGRVFGIKCGVCDGDGIYDYNKCTKIVCSDCGGSGKIYYAEHLDIAFDVYATVSVNGENKNVKFTINADDYNEGRISVSGGTVSSLGKDTSGDQNDLRLNGVFPIGTETNPISYTVSLTNKKIKVDGTEVTFSSVINNITAWGSNTCPSRAGIDVAFGNVTGTPDTPAPTEGTLTIFKALSGATDDDAQTFTFNITDTASPAKAIAPVTVTVPANNNAASTTVALPFGTYTVSEVSPADIVVGDTTYNHTATTIEYPDEDGSSATKETSFTLSAKNYGRQVNVTNTYVEEIPTPPAPTSGSITITKKINVVSDIDVNVRFDIVGGDNLTKTVDLTVKAGELSATSGEIELPIGTYAVTETLMTTEFTSGEDSYKFKQATWNNAGFTLSENNLEVAVEFTNTYEKQTPPTPPAPTEGTLTITKKITGVTPKNAETFKFTVGNETVEVTVPAGKTSGSTEITLPLGTYTVSEITANMADIVGTDDKSYEFKSATEAVEITLSADVLTATAEITNTYEEVIVTPPAPTTGKITITKNINIAPEADTTFSFRIANSKNEGINVNVTVSAGKTTATSAAIELPFDSYIVYEVSETNYTLTIGEDRYYWNGYEFVNDQFTLSENNLEVAVTCNNYYEIDVPPTTGWVYFGKIVNIAPDAATTFKYNVKSDLGANFDVEITVPAGETYGYSDGYELPFANYTVTEYTDGIESIVSGGENYSWIGAEWYNGSFELTDENCEVGVECTNNYEKFVTPPVPPTPPVVEDPTASLTITKVINGPAPTVSTTFSINIYDAATSDIIKTVDIIIPAGKKSGAVTVTDLKLGDYTILERLPSDAGYAYTSADGDSYIFMSATYTENEFSFDADNLSDRTTVTNNYIELIPVTPPAETEPVETEPVETEPVETEPVETEPVETEPVETEPVETEPVETEPVETEPVETEPVETEPVETEPVETEPVETEPVETEPVEEFEDIDDEEVPLTDIPDEPVPQTGYSTAWFVMGLLSATALTVITVKEKKDKSKNN